MKPCILRQKDFHCFFSSKMRNKMFVIEIRYDYMILYRKW
jgi:hypothetical protein